jgi:uncharacterized membrane protein YeaQ/YmgE (transglycosylase-associated protein family)
MVAASLFLLLGLADPRIGGHHLSEISGWVLLGFLAGAIARRVMPGEEKGGCLVTIALGILGALVGGWIGRNIGFLPPGVPGAWIPSLKSLLTATVGSIVVLSLWKWLRT